MNSRSLALLSGGLLGLATPAYAHHSFIAHYVDDSMVSVEGVVIEFQFRNPHSFVYIENTNDAGEVETWALEMHNTIRMGKMGFTKASFQPGEHVTATGNRARDGSNRMRLDMLQRPADDFEYLDPSTHPEVAIAAGSSLYAGDELSFEDDEN